VPYFDQQVLRPPHDCGRLLVNIGGISNATYLQSDGGARAFDVGPGCMVLDQLYSRFLASFVKTKRASLTFSVCLSGRMRTVAHWIGWQTMNKCSTLAAA
jgi:hypothetical protein